MPKLATDVDTSDELIQNKTITEKPASEIKDDDIPRYMVQYEFTEEQETRILQEIKDEFDNLKTQRGGGKDLETKWETLENQYEGKAAEDALRQFNLCKRVTKIKCDAIERLIMKAAWKASPLFSISPRPEYQKEGGDDVTQSQEDFLDYKLTQNIPFIEAERKTIHSAVVKGTGILKVTHEVKIDRKKREELYKGNPQPVMMQNPDQNGPTVIQKKSLAGELAFTNDGLDDFIKNYPDAAENHTGIIKRLMAGEEVVLVVEYDEITYNDPMPKNVQLKDFYVDENCDGYEGLKTSRLIVERMRYSYWELKRKENKKKFYNIEDLITEDIPANQGGAQVDRKRTADYNKKKYDILECTYYFKEKPDDEDEIKIVVYIAEEKWKIVGSILYPYYGLLCPYIPHYISSIWDGFYQPGIAEYLTDNNIAENAILNFTLEGVMTSNIVTPIAPKDDPIHAQFLDKRWAHGVPIEADPGKIDFLSNKMKTFNSQQLLQLLEYLGRDDGDLSGINQLITGQESQIDPRAPAAKTIALLRQSGINVEDYINSLTVAFNTIADAFLQLYYQMSKEGMRFKPHPDRVVPGGDPFKTITRSQMVARTNIQSQARAFNFDEDNERSQDLALYQTFRNEPLFVQNPEAVYVMIKNVLQGWSKKWRNKVGDLLPSLSQFRDSQTKLVANGVAQFLQQEIAAAKGSGTPVAIDPAKLMQTIQQLMASSMTPPPSQKGGGGEGQPGGGGGSQAPQSQPGDLLSMIHPGAPQALNV